MIGATTGVLGVAFFLFEIGLVVTLRDPANNLKLAKARSTGRIDADQVARLDPPPFGHEAVPALDAPFGVFACKAHVAAVVGATGQSVVAFSAHHKYGVIAGFYFGNLFAGFCYSSKHFMADHQPV